MTTNNNEDSSLFNVERMEALAKEQTAALEEEIATHSYVAALQGDRSFAERALAHLYWKIESGESLSKRDTTFLSVALNRICQSPSAMNVVCGVDKKRGRKQNGLMGMQVVLAVYTELENKISVEEAWERVAVARNLSASSIKKYWIKYKTTAMADRTKILDRVAKTMKSRLSGPTK